MSNARILAALAAIATILAPMDAAAQKRIAVIEFKAQGALDCGTPNQAASAASRCQLVTTLSDAARSGALAAFKHSGDRSHVVMTREAMAVMLKDMGRGVCVAEGECEVDMGRNIGADLVISGEMATFGDTHLVTLKLHETAKATLLETREVEASKDIEAVRQVRSAATELVTSGLGLGRGAPTAAAPDEVRVAPAAIESVTSPSPVAPVATRPSPAAPPTTSYEAPLETRRARSFYVAARGGGFIPTGKEFGAHPTIGDGGPWVTEFKTGVDLEIGAGVRLSPQFSVEAAVGIHRSSAELAESSIFVGGTSYYGTEKLDLGVTSYTASVRFVPDELPMYVLVGAGMYAAKLEDRFTASNGTVWTASYDDSPFGFHFGMGFFYPVSRNLRLEVEGGFNYAKPQFGGVESDVSGLRLAAGVSYGF